MLDLRRVVGVALASIAILSLLAASRAEAQTISGSLGSNITRCNGTTSPPAADPFVWNMCWTLQQGLINVQTGAFNGEASLEETIDAIEVLQTPMQDIKQGIISKAVPPTVHDDPGLTVGTEIPCFPSLTPGTTDCTVLSATYHIGRDADAIRQDLAAVKGDVATLKSDVATIKSGQVTMNAHLEDVVALLTEIRDQGTEPTAIDIDPGELQPVVNASEDVQTATIESSWGPLGILVGLAFLVVFWRIVRPGRT